MQNDFSLITGTAVNEVLLKNLPKIYKIIEKAYIAHALGNTAVPGSFFLRFPHNPRSRIIALPAYIADEFNVAGIKWVSSNPENLAHNLPRASAVIILNHPTTGRPFACLEGSLISAARTAASAVLAAEHMGPKNKHLNNLGLVGNGPIARTIYQYFIHNGWNIKKLTLYDVQDRATEEFLKQVDSHRQQEILITNTVEELIPSCDAIAFATNALSPYIHDFHLVDHCPLILNISLRDLGSEILLNSNNVVDDVEHILTANTSPHLAQQTCGHASFINGTLGELIQKKYQISDNKPSIFSPMGLGVLDLAVAKYVFDETLTENKQITINNFLGVEAILEDAT